MDLGCGIFVLMAFVRVVYSGIKLYAYCLDCHIEPICGYFGPLIDQPHISIQLAVKILRFINCMLYSSNNIVSHIGNI
ncbi:hypothetical protein LSH36_2092g00007, partial [Paralvinella palmiformis]